MWVYIIHFNEPYHHARHYTGATEDIISRVHRHRNGTGAALTAAAGISSWSLGHLAHCTRAFEVEKWLKSLKNGKAYCEVCRKAAGRTCRKIPGTVPYNLDALKPEVRTLIASMLQGEGDTNVQS